MTDPSHQEAPQETPGTTPLPELEPAPSPQPELDPAGAPEEMPQFGENDGTSAVQPQLGQDAAPSGPLDPEI